MMRIIKVYKSASLGCTKERHSTTHFDRCPWADVVSLHQLNEERRVKSEEFDTWVHSTVLVRNEANIFSINFLNNFKLWVNLTKCFLAPLPWVRKRVKLFILFVLLVSVLFTSASSPTRRCLNLRRRMPTWWRASCQASVLRSPWIAMASVPTTWFLIASVSWSTAKITTRMATTTLQTNFVSGAISWLFHRLSNHPRLFEKWGELEVCPRFLFL